MNGNLQPRAQWSSMTSYLLVTTGAVVGLGNIIQFPFYVYQFGGLFILLYLLCELFICIPIFLAEILIGRSGKQNPVGSFSLLSREAGASPYWRYMGWLCFIILFLGLADYAVSVSFPMAYFVDVFKMVTTTGAHPVLLQPEHAAITQHFSILEGYFLIFLLATMLVVLRGINRGLETISRVTVPLYFIILLGLAIYSCSVGDVGYALRGLFTLSSQASFFTVFVAALAYAFFKLNVGMGSMIVYGSYLPYSVPIGRSTLLIVCFDAVISLLSYFVIYPLYVPSHETAAFAHSFRETFFFFSETPNGEVMALLFFLAAAIAAWTPAIAMAESATVTLIERFDISRRRAAWVIFAGVFLVGTLIVLSYHLWETVFILHRWSVLTFLHSMMSIILIPLSALLISVFAGWVLRRGMTDNELNFKPELYSLWRFLVRYIAPVCVVITAIILMYPV